MRKLIVSLATAVLKALGAWEERPPEVPQCTTGRPLGASEVEEIISKRFPEANIRLLDTMYLAYDWEKVKEVIEAWSRPWRAVPHYWDCDDDALALVVFLRSHLLGCPVFYIEGYIAESKTHAWILCIDPDNSIRQYDHRSAEFGGLVSPKHQAYLVRG